METVSDLDKKEDKVDTEMVKEQREIDRVSKQLDELKKDTDN